jgi:hypothetical protein
MPMRRAADFHHEMHSEHHFPPSAPDAPQMTLLLRGGAEPGPL